MAAHAGVALFTAGRTSLAFRFHGTRQAGTRQAARLVVFMATRSVSGGGSGSGGATRALVWFRGTDLRLVDNTVVHEAARRVEAGQFSEVRWAADGTA